MVDEVVKTAHGELMLITERATPEDLPEIFGRLKAEGLWPVEEGWPELNEACWIRTWIQLIEQHEAFIHVHRGTDGKVCGAIGGVVRVAPETGELTGFEMLWFGSLDLVWTFEQQCKLRYAKRVLMSHVAGPRNTQFLKFFEGRRGYVKQEVIYRKEL